MSLVRTWRALGNRWFSVAPPFAVPSVIVPVAIVDDATALSLPPVNPIWGTSPTIAGVAGQLSTLVLTPTRKPIRIISVQATTAAGQIFWGVYDRSITDAIALANSIPRLLQTPSLFGGVNPAPTRDAIAVGGTTLTNLQTLFPSDGMLLRSGVTYAPNTFVLPGQAFWIQEDTVLTNLQFFDLRWEERDVPEHLETSVPRT